MPAGARSGRTGACRIVTESRTWTIRDAAEWLHVPQADDHKYRRGVLGIRAGSSEYPGAAILTVEAAWRTGLGMVRYLAPQSDPLATATPHVSTGAHASPASLVLARRPETVTVAGPVDAWLIGSGIDPAQQPAEERETFRAILTGTAPVVVDAGALPLVAALASEGSLSAPTVITPHAGEFQSLWRERFGERELPDDPWEASAVLAADLGVTVLLKGSTTLVTTPSGERLTVGPATPWLATAGTGDVLAGILGALTAAHTAALTSAQATAGAERTRVNHNSLLGLAATASLLHDCAARFATWHEDRPITALDVAEALPAAIAQVLRTRDHTESSEVPPGEAH